MTGSTYSVYIVRCNDDTYYTGITADVARRLAEHERSPRGAKYLKGRGPLTLVFSATVGDRSLASSLEYRIKKLDRRAKEALIAGRSSIDELLRNQDSGSTEG
jgi:putative endonuclease